MRTKLTCDGSCASQAEASCSHIRRTDTWSAAPSQRPTAENQTTLPATIKWLHFVLVQLVHQEKAELHRQHLLSLKLKPAYLVRNTVLGKAVVDQMLIATLAQFHRTKATSLVSSGIHEQRHDSTRTLEQFLISTQQH